MEGEYFSKEVRCSFSVKSDGCLYLTTLRLVFKADNPTNTFYGLVIP